MAGTGDEISDGFARSLASRTCSPSSIPRSARSRATQASRLAIEGGPVLFREGDRSDALYVLMSGALTAATQASDGSPSRIANFFAGETVGEMGVITGDARARRR